MNLTEAYFRANFEALRKNALSADICSCWREEVSRAACLDTLLEKRSVVELAYNYAAYVIKGRFPEGEATIAKNPHWAHYYARDVIRGRWPEGEAAIATDPHWACRYAAYVIKGRWPEGEAAIATDPHWAHYYARDVIRGRWPEGGSTEATGRAKRR